MKHFIATGFQNTVDFEIKWSPDILQSLIISHDIKDHEINRSTPIYSERDIIIALLGFMKTGTGGERFVSSNDLVCSFASHFTYDVTLGGTPVRAAISMDKLGYRCCLHACSFNRYFVDLIPKTVTWLSSVPDEGDNFYPHVILQFPQGAHIQANDIDFIVPRANRAIFDYDLPSKQLVIDESFKTYLKHTKAFLAAGYNVIEDKELLKNRLETTARILECLPQNCVTVYEDGGHEDLSIGLATINTLAPHLNILSLNEDELQSYVGAEIDISDSTQVASAIKQMYQKTNIPVLVCHSAYWSLAYGDSPLKLKSALEGGILMASTRFRLGDRFSEKDYEETKKMHPRQSSIDFCRSITELLGSDNILCLPGLDMDHIKAPVTIGLGDSFMGGFLPGLLNEEDRLFAKGTI